MIGDSARLKPTTAFVGHPNKWNAAVLGYNGIVVGIPYTSYCVLIILPNGKVELKFCDKNGLGGYDKWKYGVAVNNVVYGIPEDEARIKQILIDTDHFQTRSIQSTTSGRT